MAGLYTAWSFGWNHSFSKEGCVDFCYQVRKRGGIVFAYANNHYTGHAPATIKQFQDLWRTKGLPELNKSVRMPPKESLLFE
jgi:hypothetical protein